MSTKLIKYEDGTLVEVEVGGGQMQQIAGGIADRVNKTLDAALDRLAPLLVKACRPVITAHKDLQEMQVDQAEIEIGLSFEAEGNIYVAKSTGTANLSVKLVLRPQR